MSLYRNRGDGTFADVTAELTGVTTPGEGKSLGVVWGDYDNDGDQDHLRRQRLDAELPVPKRRQRPFRPT